MTSTTLSTCTTGGITLTATGAYGSPFTITQTGTIFEATTPDGIVSSLANAYLLNEGSIFAGTGAISFAGDATLQFAAANAPAKLLDGFSTLDAIDITDLPFTTPETLTIGAGGTLEVAQDSTTLNLTFAAADFHARYRQSAAPEHPCLPRLESGPRLAAILGRLHKRPQTTAPGPLHAIIDIATPTQCAGWAINPTCPADPARVEILGNGRRLAVTLANAPRPDVAAAGHPATNCGFAVRLPQHSHARLTVLRAAA